MKIITHGRTKEGIKTVKRFRCNSCGCVFEADKPEYSVFNNFDEKKMVLIHRCLCPDCHCVASEVIMREAGSA